MKAHYKTRSGRITFEIEGPSVKDLFRGIAELQETFEGDSACGHCNSPNIQLRVRTNDDNEFFELFCEDCHAALSFGTSRKGAIFPRRRDSKTSTTLPDRGWKIWRAAAAAGE